MKIVAIEANIGAGKSTLLKGLAEQLAMITGEDWQIIVEPVDEDPEFHRLLKDFIANPTNAEVRIVFQQYITNQRQGLLKDIPDGNYLIERSLYSDLVFCQMNMLTMERPSAHYLSYYYDIIDRLKDYPRIDCIIYIDRTPEACLKSIEKRGREGEHYELHELVDLKNFHDSCLPQICRQYGTPMVRVICGEKYASSHLVAKMAVNHMEEQNA